MSTSQLFLCVDAGGTKTASAIADAQGEVISRGQGGSANMAEIGVDRSAAEIIKATLAAIASLPPGEIPSSSSSTSSVCPIRFGGIWVGIAGCDTAKDVSDMTTRLSQFFPGPLKIMNDGLLLSSPILSNRCSWGVAAVAGTGSVVVGVRVTPEGGVEQVVRRGGQGHLVGDAGSAYHLGLTAVKFAADDFDFGLEVPGGLADAVRSYYGVTSTADAPSALHDLDTTVDSVTAGNLRKLRIASLAPSIMSLFTSTPPCPLSTRVVHHCARVLAVDIAAVVRRSQALGCGEAGGATLSLTGGVAAQEAFREVLVGELEGLGVQFGWVEVVVDAAGKGAVAIALAGKGK